MILINHSQRIQGMIAFVDTYCHSCLVIGKLLKHFQNLNFQLIDPTLHEAIVAGIHHIKCLSRRVLIDLDSAHYID